MFTVAIQSQECIFTLLRKIILAMCPTSLIKLLGDIVYSFEFDLSKDRKLVKAEALEVIRNMEENGYFLQLPPAKSEMLGLKIN